MIFHFCYTYKVSHEMGITGFMHWSFMDKKSGAEVKYVIQ